MAHHSQHQHGAGNSAEYSVTLERMNRFQEPEVRQAIADLQLPRGSYGLDVGCGVGLVCSVAGRGCRATGAGAGPGAPGRARGCSPASGG